MMMGRRENGMAGLAQLLGLKPKTHGRIGDAAARELALAHVRTDGSEMLAEGTGVLVWDASGRAVWRFRWHSPVPGVPELMIDVDAARGAVVRWCGGAGGGTGAIAPRNGGP